MYIIMAASRLIARILDADSLALLYILMATCWFFSLPHIAEYMVLSLHAIMA